MHQPVRKTKGLTRRQFLKASGITPLASLLAGLPDGWAGGVYASDAPETPKIRFGIIAQMSK